MLLFGYSVSISSFKISYDRCRGKSKLLPHCKKKKKSSHLRNEQYDRKVTCSSKILYTMFFSESESPANAYQSRAADNERSVDENTVHASLRQESKPILGRFLST